MIVVMCCHLISWLWRRRMFNSFSLSSYLFVFVTYLTFNFLSFFSPRNVNLSFYNLQGLSRDICCGDMTGIGGHKSSHAGLGATATPKYPKNFSFIVVLVTNIFKLFIPVIPKLKFVLYFMHMLWIVGFVYKFVSRRSIFKTIIYSRVAARAAVLVGFRHHTPIMR